MRVLALIGCAWVLGAAAPLQAPPNNQPADKGAQAEGPDAKGSPSVPTTAPALLQQLEQGPSAEPRREGDGDNADRPNWAEIGAFWAGAAQAVVGALGLTGLFFTVLYAKRAWLAAKSSAEADNAALAEARTAAADARREAAEQAKRVSEQLSETRKMAVAAQESAEAAKRAVDVAADTATKQLRPYVYIVDEKVSVSVVHAGSIGSVKAFPSDRAPVSFSIKNFGQTPAKRVRLRARTSIGEHWTDGGPMDLDASAVIHRADMPPGFERPILGHAANGITDVYQSLVTGTRTIFFDGLIEYEDAGGRRYQTSFRRACTGQDAIHQGTFFITPEGNEAT